MKEIIVGLHEEMEQAIGRLGGETGSKAVAEEGFKSATLYWQRVRELVRQYGFANDADEIEFFKHLKAKFTGVLEHYLLLFRHHVNANDGPAALEQFRSKETERIRKFRQAHAPFIQYYEEGRTEWDDMYFLRRKFNRVQRPSSQVYDRATDFWTNGDWIVTFLYSDRLSREFLDRTALPSNDQ